MFARRKGNCVLCQRLDELVQRDLCKPCYRSHKCESCDAVNRATNVISCSRCFVTRRCRSTDQARLAMWCVHCTSAADRASLLCRVCLRDRATWKCHHCGTKEQVLEDVFPCSTADCAARMRFCMNCICLGRDCSVVQCKRCWRAHGDLCIMCQVQRARIHANMLRQCFTCAKLTFCERCNPNRPPPAIVHVWQCRMCPRKALWCNQHCSELEVMAHLCRHHYDLHTKCCTHCV